MPDSREISFVLRSRFDDAPGERGRVIRLDVGPDIVWDMLPNPLSRRSIISPEALNDLRARGLVPGRAGTVDGILGLDFFEQFDLVYWHPRTHRVTLVLP